MDLLEQLVFNGTAEKKFEKADGKLNFTLKTLTGDQQLNIEDEMKGLKSNPTFIVHKYSMKMLSNGLIQYQDKDFSKQNPEVIEKFLGTLSTTIIDLLTQIQNEFQKECAELLNPENLENFSETPSTDSDLK